MPELTNELADLEAAIAALNEEHERNVSEFKARMKPLNDRRDSLLAKVKAAGVLAGMNDKERAALKAAALDS